MFPRRVSRISHCVVKWFQVMNGLLWIGNFIHSHAFFKVVCGFVVRPWSVRPPSDPFRMTTSILLTPAQDVDGKVEMVYVPWIISSGSSVSRDVINYLWSPSFFSSRMRSLLSIGRGHVLHDCCWVHLVVCYLVEVVVWWLGSWKLNRMVTALLI